MFNFQARFLQKPTTTITPDEPTERAAKSATNNLQSRLLKERQSRAMNGRQYCARCGLPYSRG